MNLGCKVFIFWINNKSIILQIIAVFSVPFEQKKNRNILSNYRFIIDSKDENFTTPRI